MGREAVRPDVLVVFISMTLSLSLGKSAAFAVCDLLKEGGWG